MTPVAEREPWPVEIRLLRAEKALEIEFDDGKTLRFPAEFLRVETPSAEARGHGGVGGAPVVGKEHVGIDAVEPVGNYAIRILFDDGHDTGIYSWRLLRELAQKRTG